MNHRNDDPRNAETLQKKSMGRAETASGEELPFGKHWTLAQFARSLNIGREKARQILLRDPDVIKMLDGKKKAHIHYLIPDAIAQRIYQRMKNESKRVG